MPRGSGASTGISKQESSPENEGTTGIAGLVSSDGEFDLARMLDGASRDCWLRYDRRPLSHHASCHWPTLAFRHALCYTP
jgi:hypothetical protein